MIPIAKPLIGEAEKQAVLDVLDSGMLVQGPRVAELEAQWAQVCGTRHAIAIVNGTAALHVAMLANGIEPGDEVITTPFTFMASVNSILYVGARPVFVDIDPDTFNINVNQIEAAITPRTRAILPVHLYGRPADMDPILKLAARHGLKVIEDAAQAIGAHYKGRPVGSFGTACFSLYATKNVMSAEGGMITTDDDEIARLCQLLRQHGSERRYYHDMLGFNFRLSDLHAAIGLAQLGRLHELTTRRQANARTLNQHIQNPLVITPTIDNTPETDSVWHQYTIRVVGMNRDAAVQQLTAAGIGTSIFYPVPAHQQRHIIEMGYAQDVVLPVAERIANEVLSLPVHPALSEDDLSSIIAAVNALHST